jgi:ribosomal-protein-alanine N-acetyltransferase
MRIRDIEEVVAIERASFRDPWSPGAFAAEATAQEGRSWAWVVEAEGSVVGYLVAWPVAEEVHLANLAVHPRWRRRGIGSFLLRHLLERARERGAAWVALEVRVSNEAARRLYERFGFRAVAVRKGYYQKEREDALVMMRHLDGERGSREA